MADRPLRADARDNRERLLAAASSAFAREGTQASLKAVAREAGVGVGTLYRHFPTREALVEAVYEHEVTLLCNAAAELLGELPPVAALRAWMERFVDFMAAKEGMADLLRPVLLSDADRMHTRARLRAAIAVLLDAGAPDLDAGMSDLDVRMPDLDGGVPHASGGAGEGAIRSGVDAYELLMALGGIVMIAGQERQRDLASRLIDLLLRGVTI